MLDEETKLFRAMSDAHAMVFWDECTPEARPLAQLDIDSTKALSAGVSELRNAAITGHGVADAARHLRQAMLDFDRAVSGWGLTDDPLGRLQGCVGRLCRLASGDDS